LQKQFDRGVQRGTINRNEARPLRDQLRALKALERRYSRGGFSRTEQRSLQQQIQRVQQRIQSAAANRR
jgi:hypothetical protein